MYSETGCILQFVNYKSTALIRKKKTLPSVLNDVERKKKA